MSRADRFGLGWLSKATRGHWLSVCALASLSLMACARADSEGSGSRVQTLTEDDGSTGVALCDSYLDQYENCVIPGLPESQVQRHKTGIVRQRQAWLSLATTAAKQDSLLRICRGAIATARREFPACGFSGG